MWVLAVTTECLILRRDAREILALQATIPTAAHNCVLDLGGPRPTTVFVNPFQDLHQRLMTIVWLVSA